MLIEHEVNGDIEELENLFKLFPKKTEMAIDRTMRKLGRWAEVHVLRAMSRELKISQKLPSYNKRITPVTVKLAQSL